MIIADLRIYMAKFEKRLFAPPCRICILITALCQVGILGLTHWPLWNDQKLASLDLGRWSFQTHLQPTLVQADPFIVDRSVDPCISEHTSKTINH